MKENSENKVVLDYDTLAKATEGLRAVGRKIVLTVGSWDLLHIGHARYLNQAKGYGDILVVGVDTDRVIRAYKGEFRPVVPENERCEMLCYQSCVDFVTHLDDVDSEGKWEYALLKKLRPDIFVAVEDSYPGRQLDDIKQYCKNLVVLPRQAKETSTSKMIQNTVKKHLDKLYEFAGVKKEAQ